MLEVTNRYENKKPIITAPITSDIESAPVDSSHLISFSEQPPLLNSIKALMIAVNDLEIRSELDSIYKEIESSQDEADIDDDLKKTLEKLITGSPQQALTAGTAAFFVGFAAGIASNVTISQTSLSDSYKTLLTGLGAISGGFGRLKLGIEVNKNGGSRLTSQFLLMSLLGLSITAAIANSSDPTTINSMIDYRTVGLLIGALLSGFGISTFAQVSNVINWHQEAGHPSAILGGIAGLAPGIVGLIRFALLELFGEEVGQTITYAFLIASLATSTYALTYSKNVSLVDSPCHQLMNNYGLSMKEVTLLAEIYGQTFLPSENLHGDWAELAKQLRSLKVWILITNYVFAFGGFLGMTASLNLALSSWGYDQKSAALITSLFSLWSSLCRAIIAYPINFLGLDSFGGGIVNSIGAVFVLGSALSIAIPNDVPEFKRLIPALTLMAIGFGISCAATFKCVSSEVHKEKEQAATVPIVAAKTNALVSCIGTLGSVIYTMGGGQLAAQNSEQPELGYVQIFYAIAGLSIIGGIPVLLMSYSNKDLLITQQTIITEKAKTNSKKTNGKQERFFFESQDALATPPLPELSNGLSNSVSSLI